MSAFWNIENIEDDIPKCRFLFTMYRDEDITFKSFFIYHVSWRAHYL
jgi:hypothetical protein